MTDPFSPFDTCAVAFGTSYFLAKSYGLFTLKPKASAGGNERFLDAETMDRLRLFAWACLLIGLYVLAQLAFPQLRIL